MSTAQGRERPPPEAAGPPLHPQVACAGRRGQRARISRRPWAPRHREAAPSSPASFSDLPRDTSRAKEPDLRQRDATSLQEKLLLPTERRTFPTQPPRPSLLPPPPSTQSALCSREQSWYTSSVRMGARACVMGWGAGGGRGLLPLPRKHKIHLLSASLAFPVAVFFFFFCLHPACLILHLTFSFYKW